VDQIGEQQVEKKIARESGSISRAGIQDSIAIWKSLNEKETEGGFLSGMPLISVITKAIGLLQHKKMLWMAPKGASETRPIDIGNNVDHVQVIKNFFSRLSSSFLCEITYAESPHEAIEFIKNNKYNIIISHYGEHQELSDDSLSLRTNKQNNKSNKIIIQKDKQQDDKKKTEKTTGTPAVVSILKFLRGLEWNDERLCPVVVYAEEPRERRRDMFNQRRKQLLALGAQEYCTHISILIKSIHRILKSLS